MSIGKTLEGDAARRNRYIAEVRTDVGPALRDLIHEYRTLTARPTPNAKKVNPIAVEIHEKQARLRKIVAWLEAHGADDVASHVKPDWKRKYPKI